MSNTKSEPIIPEQQKGGSSDTDATETFDSAQQAKDFYNIVKQRLQQVNNWQKWAGAATATFQLTDAQGNDVDRTVQEGDHFKIDIPGPGPVTGDGFDWVQVETIKETVEPDSEEIAIQVRPATNPNNDRQDVAHFFSDEASSCFIVKREGATVTAAVHGRNEKPNTNAEKVVDKARNAAVATGAITAFSKLQWKSLVNGLVKRD
jgi:flagellar hook-basal body complex protein FliE